VGYDSSKQLFEIEVLDMEESYSNLTLSVRFTHPNASAVLSRSQVSLSNLEYTAKTGIEKFAESVAGPTQASTSVISLLTVMMGSTSIVAFL
jgi:hypothetical protein